MPLGPRIFMKSLCVPYAFLMRKSLGLVRSPFVGCHATRNGGGAEMLAAIFVVSCLSVFGFYVYVLVHLRREEKREDAQKKRLPQHFYEMGPGLHEDDAENRQDPDSLRTGKSIRHNSRGVEARLRRETMVGVGLTVGGLAAVLAGIEFLNALVTWLHWY
jgi:hypothetical protein